MEITLNRNRFISVLKPLYCHSHFARFRPGIVEERCCGVFAKPYGDDLILMASNRNFLCINIAYDAYPNIVDRPKFFFIKTHTGFKMDKQIAEDLKITKSQENITLDFQTSNEVEFDIWPIEDIIESEMLGDENEPGNWINVILFHSFDSEDKEYPRTNWVNGKNSVKFKISEFHNLIILYSGFTGADSGLITLIAPGKEKGWNDNFPESASWLKKYIEERKK